MGVTGISNLKDTVDLWNKLAPQHASDERSWQHDASLLVAPPDAAGILEAMLSTSKRTFLLFINCRKCLAGHARLVNLAKEDTVIMYLHQLFWSSTVCSK